MTALLASAQAVMLRVASNAFIPFAVLFMNRPLKPGFVWAGPCLAGAV